MDGVEDVLCGAASNFIANTHKHVYNLILLHSEKYRIYFPNLVMREETMFSTYHRLKKRKIQARKMLAKFSASNVSRTLHARDTIEIFSDFVHDY